MGLDANGTRFLLYAKLLGVDFSRTAMIGRQGLHLEPGELAANLEDLGFPAERRAIERIFDANDGYAEELLRFLGAETADSIDYSDYEGATRVHDLNRSLPEDLTGSYSAVLDGGSLEHVFDFPRALANCLRMVRPGGHFLAITPANNFMGHGFYQFSPELFLSALTPANGYELERLIAFEDKPGAPWYLISRPRKPGTRIQLRSSKPVYLLVLARRIDATEPFRSMPQQSDYAPTWDPEGVGSITPSPGRGPLMRALLRRTPERLKQVIKIALGRERRKWRFDPRSFHRLDWRRELAACRRRTESAP